LRKTTIPVDALTPFDRLTCKAENETAESAFERERERERGRTREEVKERDGRGRGEVYHRKTKGKMIIIPFFPLELD